MTKKQLPYVASNIDDFINNNAQLQSPRERNVSSSSVENDDNYDQEPYSRRDFRIDVKPSDKISNDNSSGYFTSPNENEKALRTENVFSPESSDYERFEFQKNIVKNRDEYSSSPADSQSGRSVSSNRKSVSFDLDVEEFTPEYSPEDDVEKLRIQKLNDEDVFYEKSHYHHHQLQPEPKRIKGILRSPSPSVYYKGNVYSRVAVEKEFIEDDGDSEVEKENPFRKEYLSQENLNVFVDDSSTAQGVISEPDRFDIGYQSTRRSHENLNSKIPIKKPIFKATGSLVDRPKIPPPRPPQPYIKVAEMVRNEGLVKMSQQMEQNDFLEFVHNAETNTVEEVKGQEEELFDPDDPLPPLPKCPPPMEYKRLSSFDRPKASPPPPPTLKSPVVMEEILEILPAKFNTLPTKQKPHFVNENSQNNILVTEDEHREILLTENEIRNAMLSEYDEKISPNSEKLIANFSPTNPFLDDSSSFDSSSFQSTPNFLSPVSTLDKSGSSFGQYAPSYQTGQHVQPINFFPPPAQVLPVHYGQLPKPQQAGYYPLMSHQYPVHYNAPSTGIVSPTPPNQTYVQQQSYSESSYGVEQHHQQQQQQRAYLVSGDGQNNFYVTHNVNNTANNQQQHQTLLMQSAYGPPSQPSPPNQTSLQQMQMHLQASHSQQFVTGTTRNNNQPQFIYEQHQQPQHQFYQNNLRNNNLIQYAQHQQNNIMDSASELSPIRINPVPHNFVYPSSSENVQKPSMSSFGKHTEV